MPLASGTRLGPYEITDKLGEGGMGEVYRARDARLEREVAVKVLPADVAGDVDRLRRFEHEARAASALSHPNIITVLDVGLVGTTSFLVTELLEGTTLRERLGDGPLPCRNAIEIAVDVARALAAAHSKGIVHRDLKPENVFLTRDGVVKILDFGLAKLVSPESEESSEAPTVSGLTASGAVLGTAGYMAPEQVRGEPADARSDLFSLGCVLYEMVAGRRAFAANSAPEAMSAILRDDPPPLELVGPTAAVLEGIIRRCLEKRSDDRFQSARDLGFALEALKPTAVHAAPPATSALHAPRHRWKVAALVLASLAVGAASAVGVLRFTRAQEARPPRLVRLNVDLPDGVELAPVEFRGAPVVALSPDGLTMVLVGTSDGASRLYRRRIDSVSAQPIPGSEGGRAPFFSPDGTWVGFWANGRIQKVPVAGGEPTAICDAEDEVGATWGTDGTILFGTNGGLFSVPASGGKAAPVTTPDAARNEYSHINPQVLPGGSSALFEVDLIGDALQAREVAVLNLRNGRWRTLVPGAGSPRYLPPNLLVVDSAGVLEASRFDPQSATLSGPLAPIRMSGLSESGRSLSYDIAGPSGTIVYAVAPAAPQERALYWVRRDGTKQLVTPERRLYYYPEISPDGRRVAVSISINPTTSEIWVLDLERGGWQRMTSGGNDWEPVWSRDGRSLFYPSARGNGTGTWDLFTLPSDGSGAPRKIATYSHQVGSEALAPDDLSVLWDDMRGGMWLQRIDSKQAPRRFLPNEPSASAMSLSFSPDGRWLAYVAENGGTPQVYATDFPDGNHRYAVSNGQGGSPVWSRDGREIYFARGQRILAAPVHADGSLSVDDPQLVTKLPFERQSTFDVSRDGSKILAVAAGTAGRQHEPIVCIPDLLTARPPT